MRTFGRRGVGKRTMACVQIAPDGRLDWAGQVADVLASIEHRIDTGGYKNLPIQDMVTWNGASMIEQFTQFDEVDGKRRERRLHKLYDWGGAIAFAKSMELEELADIVSRLRAVQNARSAEEAARLEVSDDEQAEREHWNKLTGLIKEWSSIAPRFDLNDAMRRFVARNYPN